MGSTTKKVSVKNCNPEAFSRKCLVILFQALNAVRDD